MNLRFDYIKLLPPNKSHFFMENADILITHSTTDSEDNDGIIPPSAKRIKLVRKNQLTPITDLNFRYFQFSDGKFTQTGQYKKSSFLFDQ